MERRYWIFSMSQPLNIYHLPIMDKHQLTYFSVCIHWATSLEKAVSVYTTAKDTPFHVIQLWLFGEVLF